MNKITAASGEKSNLVLLNEIKLEQGLDQKKILDLGAGRGHLTYEIKTFLEQEYRVSDVKDVLYACDISPESFMVEGVDCQFCDANQKLIYDDDTFDIIVTQEVIEHLKRPYDYIEELYRVLKKGGVVIITTPNINSLRSRLQNFFTGFHTMYEPLSFKKEDAGRLCGHIMPLSYFYIDHYMRRVGFSKNQLLVDKISNTNKVLYFIFKLLLSFQYYKWLNKLRKKNNYLLEVNSVSLGKVNSFEGLCARTMIIKSTK